MIALTLYSRPGCHLCDDMKAVIARVRRDVASTLQEIDISGHADLEKAYGLEIPVLMVNGKKAAKIRISDDELAKILAGRAGK